MKFGRSCYNYTNSYNPITYIRTLSKALSRAFIKLYIEVYSKALYIFFSKLYLVKLYSF